MTLLTQIENAKTLWGKVLPTVPLPPDASFSMWLSSFGAQALEAVINEIPYRLTRSTVPPTDAIYRIVSAQLKSRKARMTATAVKDSSFESLLNAVRQTELTERSICQCYAMFVMQELSNSKAGLSIFSDAMLTDTVYINSQSLLSKPNLKLVASKSRTIVDTLEARAGTGEGQALTRLREFESVLRAQMKRQVR